MSKKKRSVKDLHLENKSNMLNLLASLTQGTTEVALDALNKLSAAELNRPYNDLITKKSMYVLEFAAQCGNIKVLEKILQTSGIQFNQAVTYALQAKHFDSLITLKLYGATLNPTKYSEDAFMTPLGKLEISALLKTLNNVDSILNTFWQTHKGSFSKQDYESILILTKLSGIDYVEAKLNLLKQADKTSTLDVAATIEQVKKSFDSNLHENIDLTWQEEVCTTTTSEEVQPIGDSNNSDIFNEVD